MDFVSVVLVSQEVLKSINMTDAFEKSARKEIVETPTNKFSLRKKRRIMDVNYDDELNSRDSDDESTKRKEIVEAPENKFSVRKKRRIMDVNYDDDLNNHDSDDESTKRKEVVETPGNKFSLHKKRRIIDVNYDDELNSQDSDDESDRMKKKVAVLCTPVSTPARSEHDSKFLERMEARTLVGSPVWLKKHGHRRLDCAEMTLREKFIEDTQFYAENKKHFEHDLRGFMNQQGKTIRKPPVWHGIELNLFQLYMAVHDLGGSDMVSEKKKWLSMYKDIFGPSSNKVQTAHNLKSYYMKNILPYELYLNGGDCITAVEDSCSVKSVATPAQSHIVSDNEVMYERQVSGEDLELDTMNVEIEQSELEGFAAELKEAGYEEVQVENKDIQIVFNENKQDDTNIFQVGYGDLTENVNVVQVGLEETLQKIAQDVGLDLEDLL